MALQMSAQAQSQVPNTMTEVIQFGKAPVCRPKSSQISSWKAGNTRKPLLVTHPWPGRTSVVQNAKTAFCTMPSDVVMRCDEFGQGHHLQILQDELVIASLEMF